MSRRATTSREGAGTASRRAKTATTVATPTSARTICAVSMPAPTVRCSPTRLPGTPPRAYQAADGRNRHSCVIAAIGVITHAALMPDDLPAEVAAEVPAAQRVVIPVFDGVELLDVT